MTAAWTQLGLLEGTDEDHYVRDEVLALDPTHTTNAQRVVDLDRLGYLPRPILDPTYGYGGMWTDLCPAGLTACELDGDKLERNVDPIWVDHWIGFVDFTALPFEDNEFKSTLYDPPYRFVGTASQPDEGGHDDRYGTAPKRTKAEQMALVLDGARECARVTSEYVIVKCQRQVVSGTIYHQPYVVTRMMNGLGWRLKDELHLLSYRAQPAGRSQRNSRSNYSTFLVFVPDARADEMLRF